MILAIFYKAIEIFGGGVMLYKHEYIKARVRGI
jgi:hypothetical protein